jgi:membrane-associated phospholipid phosphatase
MSRIFLLSFVSCLTLFVHAQNIDINLLKDINLNRSKSLDGTCNVISNTAIPVSFVTPLAFWTFGKITHNEKSIEHGVISGTAVGLTFILSYATKYAVHRERPHKKYPEIEEYASSSSPSFPSHHTAQAFCTATSLSLAYPKWYIIVTSYTWASAVAYSRLHLGEHYPSDVLMGAIIGTGSAIICHKLNKWIMKQYHHIL